MAMTRRQGSYGMVAVRLLSFLFHVVAVLIQKEATIEKIDALFEKIDAPFLKIDAPFGKPVATLL